ncbi:DUF2341 domain-containing protein [Casimicrobium huifangae]|uniref:DUF2341 domain-containing protein n=1 Tax=Casimicrobium huifangae TaxID=2591109 RepID=UPI003784BDC1
MLLAMFGASSPVVAQPAGWTRAVPITITENSATASTGYQMRLVLDTSTMAPNAADLRFGADVAGTTLLDYWIESGAGTATTVVWVKLPALAASGTLTIYMFSGNPSAVTASTVNVFDYVDANANSATNQVDTGGSGGATNSQRGFRFTPNEDVLLTQFGKREPNGTPRYVTLFNFATQAVIAQQQISGPAATYVYADAAQPLWLTAGTQYILTLYQGATDGYYFGTSSQINSKLTYGDMRYCNSCTENTFPTSILSNWHYGYPDFQFRTKRTLSPAPTYVVNVRTIGGTVTGLSGSGLVLSLSAGSTQTLSVSANGSFTFAQSVSNAQSYAVTVQTQPSAPTQTCTVTNGTGPAAPANITDVAVNCTTNTYTVGGTVSGLAGTGLVLSLNAGAQTVPVTANGAFNFPTAIASGGTYTVTVQTQPSAPTQTCSMTNASGSVSSSNVTSISVSCTTNTYTVGGTVSGLTGSGLVLSLNAGAQTLPVAANGSFTFPIALTSGSNYAVTVQTQPSGPVQSCTLANGNGTIGGANVTNVTVTCATNTYSVGGSVTGLAGTGLVLSLNAGAQTLPVAANGAFTFPTALASGSSYAVTVQTQPGSPTQSCQHHQHCRQLHDQHLHHWWHGKWPCRHRPGAVAQRRRTDTAHRSQRRLHVPDCAAVRCKLCRDRADATVRPGADLRRHQRNRDRRRCQRHQCQRRVHDRTTDDLGGFTWIVVHGDTADPLKRPRWHGALFCDHLDRRRNAAKRHRLRRFVDWQCIHDGADHRQLHDRCCIANTSRTCIERHAGAAARGCRRGRGPAAPASHLSSDLRAPCSPGRRARSGGLSVCADWNGACE